MQFTLKTMLVKYNSKDKLDEIVKKVFKNNAC